MEPLLLSKRDTAHVLGVSIRTVDHLFASKELPFRRIGRRILVSRQALEQFARRDHPTRSQEQKPR